VFYLRQPIRWNYVAGFALMVLAVAVILKKWCPTVFVGERGSAGACFYNSFANPWQQNRL